MLPLWLRGPELKNGEQAFVFQDEDPGRGLILKKEFSWRRTMEGHSQVRTRVITLHGSPARASREFVK